MDFQKRIELSKYKSFDSKLIQFMPTYLSSKYRVHNLFFKKCDNEINSYQNCIDDKNWYYLHN
jgi:hypothetical protein